MQRELVAQVATLRDLDRVNFTNEVSDRRVWCRQLLAVSVITMHPSDWCVVAAFGDQVTRVARHGVVGIVVDLAACNDWHPLVE